MIVLSAQGGQSLCARTLGVLAAGGLRTFRVTLISLRDADVTGRRGARPRAEVRRPRQRKVRSRCEALFR
jgi:hypothetical protein